jgi:hypothetical protein
MAQLIQKQEEVTFQIGERVYIQALDRGGYIDNYSPAYKTVYGTIDKVNKISVRMLGVDGNQYTATMKEVKKYIDPFA